MSIVDAVLACTDSILSVRDQIGAIKHQVYMLTRTWSGDEIGEGTPTDSLTQILPTPHIVDLSHSLNIREGGMIKQGDLILKSISRQSYPNESDIDCTKTIENVERYYFIDGRIYEVISVKRKYVTWQIQIRRTIKQKTFIPEPEPEPEEENDEP